MNGRRRPASPAGRLTANDLEERRKKGGRWGKHGFPHARRRGWDSNPRPGVTRAAVFKTAPFDRSGTPPGPDPTGPKRLRRPAGGGSSVSGVDGPKSALVVTSSRPRAPGRKQPPAR